MSVIIIIILYNWALVIKRDYIKISGCKLRYGYNIHTIDFRSIGIYIIVYGIIFLLIMAARKEFIIEVEWERNLKSASILEFRGVLL